MERTLYIDGVETDASDLTNTEDTKIEEILLGRRTVARYGVIDGLKCSNSGNRINIDTGRLLFVNGEVGQLETAISNITGSSFEKDVSTFVGLRLTEATSNPKPHEVDPTVFDTRANPVLVAELFVAGDPTAAGRSSALRAAVDAELNDGNFVLLAEFVGTGTGIGATPTQQTPLPASKGGQDPYRSTVYTKDQIGGVVSLYADPSNDQFPIESAEDHFHRSLIGSGLPNPRNPHGTTLHDIGGDAVLEQTITKHQYDFHANGIIGLDPGDDDFTPQNGTFAWAANADGTVTIHDIATGEAIVIRGKERSQGEITSFGADGTQRLSFTSPSHAAGLYYILCRFASTDPQPTFVIMLKATLDALCVNSDGTPCWVNNAVDSDGERKFLAIGLVQWDGAGNFVNLNANPTITIPSGGNLSYLNNLPAGHPFLIPANQKMLDLRRCGTITNENVQRRTLRPDRLTEIVITEGMFVVHAGARIVGGTVVPSGVGPSNHASPGPDNTILKHLTDFDAFSLFGHRIGIGPVQHSLAVHSGTVNPATGIVTDENPTGSGYQSARDKWRQDHLTMTMLCFADLNQIQDGEHAMGNAAAVFSNNGGGLIVNGAGSYTFYRPGYITNFAGHIQRRPTSASRSLIVTIHTRSIGAVIGAGPSAGTMYNGGGAQTSTDVLSWLGGTPQNNIICLNSALVLPINATPNVPVQIQLSRRKDNSNTDWQNLCVTMEYHFTQGQ